MSLTLPVAGAGGGDFKRLPAGSHIAVCNLVADCGMQPGSALYPAPKRKLYVRFEVPSERVEYERDGEKHEGPQVIGIWYTASMHEKSTLRKHLEGWRGRKFTDDEASQFDVASILGKACMLNVVEVERGERTYSNVAGIGKLPKGTNVPAAENPLLYYGNDGDHAALAALPAWLQKRVGEQIKPDAVPAEKGSDEPPFVDDEIPF